MGIRQTLNENPSISTGLTILFIVAVIGFIGWEIRNQRQNISHGPVKTFYSDDDGKTYFADEADKITPFVDEKGSPAVQAVVFRCKDGPPFVGYLLRYNQEGRKAAERMKESPPVAHGFHVDAMSMTEVKKPGAKTWLKFDPRNPKAYSDITMPLCPDGSTTGLRPVYPAP